MSSRGLRNGAAVLTSCCSTWMELQRLTWDSELYYTPNAVLLLDRPLDYDVADADIAGRLIVGLIEDPRPLNGGKE